MCCKHAKATKSGRLECTYRDELEGEGKTSPSSSTRKMCPYQKYCQKDYIWMLINVNNCKKFESC